MKGYLKIRGETFDLLPELLPAPLTYGRYSLADMARNYSRTERLMEFGRLPTLKLHQLVNQDSVGAFAELKNRGIFDSVVEDYRLRKLIAGRKGFGWRGEKWEPL